MNRLTLSTLFGLTAGSARSLPFPRGRGKGASAPRVRGLLSVLLTATAIAACSPPEPTERLVLEGAFDIPVLEDSWIPEDCGIMEGYRAEYEFVCVAYPVDSERVFQNEYTAALIASGWNFAGGAATAYYLERPLNDECSDRLNLAAFLIGDETEVDKWGTDQEDELDWSRVDGATAFDIEANPVCGDERYIHD